MKNHSRTSACEKVGNVAKNIVFAPLQIMSYVLKNPASSLICFLALQSQLPSVQAYGYDNPMPRMPEPPKDNTNFSPKIDHNGWGGSHSSGSSYQYNPYSDTHTARFQYNTDKGSGHIQATGRVGEQPTVEAGVGFNF